MSKVTDEGLAQVVAAYRETFERQHRGQYNAIRAALVAFLENPPQSALDAAERSEYWRAILKRKLRAIAAALKVTP